MASLSGFGEKRRSHFTYVWAIENSPFFLFFKQLSSPVFTVKMMKMTQWKLRLSSFHSNIRLIIKREDDDDDSEPIEIECELSFLNADGLPVIKRTTTRSFFGRRSNGFSVFADANEIFLRRKEELLPKGILIVRCHIWWKRAKALNPDVCLGNTHIGIDVHRFVWAIKDFSRLSFAHKTTKVLKSHSEGVPELSLEFFSKECDGKVHINIDIIFGDIIKARGVLGKITHLGAHGALLCFEGIFKHVFGNKTNLCSKYFETEMLPSDKTNLFPNDVLLLRCEFGIVSGPSRKTIEKCRKMEYSEQNVIKTGEKGKSAEELVESISTTCNNMQNIQKIYEQGSVIKISQVENVSFPDCKIIQQDNITLGADVETIPDQESNQQDNVEFQADVESISDQKNNHKDNLSLQVDVESISDKKINHKDNFSLQVDVESISDQKNNQQNSDTLRFQVQYIPDQDINQQDNATLRTDVESISDQKINQKDNLNFQTDVESFPVHKITQQDDKTKEKYSDDSAIDVCPFSDVLYKFYEEKILTDAILQTSSENFQVHKVVLCCRSAVLSAMLTRNVDAEANTSVKITESSDTLRRLLLYIYTNEVQEMQWEDAIVLFKAASKNELLGLKEKRSAVLRLNISRVNFCDILSLAYMHHETDLLETVLDFISRNSDVFRSEVWRLFKKENPELAFDTMERTIYSFRSFIQ